VRAVDADVLACGANRFVPEHPRASRVLEELANGDAPWAVPWPAAHAFLRLVSHPHAVARPLAATDAWAFLRLLISSPSLRMLGPTARHAAVITELLEAVGPGAPVPAGLETAAILREHGVRELLSGDRAMRRYAFLTVRDPLRGAPWTAAEPPSRRYRVLRPRGLAT
jgi:predicted nucleic acid-binding protein